MIKPLFKDPIVRVVPAFWALVSLFYVVPVLPIGWRAALSDNFLDVPLLPVVVLASWFRLRSIDGQQERRFWILWGCSFTAWLLISLPSALLPPASWTFGWSLYADFLRLVVYLFQILAIEMRPHRQHGGSFNEHEQQLRSVGLAVLSFFWLAYFVLVPATFAGSEYRSKIPSFYLYVMLDAIVFGRLVWLRRETWSVRWTMIYSWLAAAAGLVFVGDI